LYWGHESARDNFSLQIGNLTKEAYISLGDKPVIIGECGIPMDMKFVFLLVPQTHRLNLLISFVFSEKEAFRTGDFRWQAQMMDAMITGLERSLLGFTYALLSLSGSPTYDFFSDYGTTMRIIQMNMAIHGMGKTSRGSEHPIAPRRNRSQPCQTFKPPPQANN